MLKALSLMGQLGYGYNKESFDRAIAEDIDYIGVDAGSIDSGPFFLGSGSMKANYQATRNDLEYPLIEASKRGIPFIVGSAGYAGADVHLDGFMEVVRDIARDNNLHLKVAVIHSELDKEYVLSLLREGKIKSYEGNPELNEEDILSSTHIVAQMGVSKFIEALKMGADLIVAGRATDASIYAAYPLLKGYDPALVWHMSKIIECGALCAKPASPSDALLGFVDDDAFYLRPPNPVRRCTPSSALAHSLYENTDPYVIEEPDGTLFLNNAVYEEYDQRTVRIYGAEWKEKSKKSFKLEGARFSGYRTIAIMGIRNPDMIAQLDGILDDVRDRAASEFGDGFSLTFRQYGKNGVLGSFEFDSNLHEVGLIVDVVAEDQRFAHRVCSVVKAHLQHYDYKGRIATGANVAFPYSPAEIDVGGVYEFSVYHIAEDEKIEDRFYIEEIEL
ncbi:acyclic terpene utilization AtuA family protein [Hippea sp. KM1]|uniref:acyclic terpene utilization AtuA family protein n=1 Tax=Hippea sp. KM1 TaxID=944481 RepID=UPI00046CCD10|nr:acyclic terpene utilization AtuA family protein [Hippea sp. KM1]